MSLGPVPFSLPPFSLPVIAHAGTGEARTLDAAKHVERVVRLAVTVRASLNIWTCPGFGFRVRVPGFWFWTCPGFGF